MFVATVVVSVLIAALAAFSGGSKLARSPMQLAAMEAVRFPVDRMWLLGAAELAGAAGVLAGLLWWPLGAAAATGLVLYFVGAVLAHLRVGDVKGVVNPVLPLALSVGALVLRLLTV